MNTRLTGPLRRLASFVKPQSPRGVLPSGNYYTILWGVPATFGGLTATSLERASAFARQDNREITFLTFSLFNGGKETEAKLKQQGRIDPRVRFLNVWEDLPTWPDSDLARMKGTARQVPEAVDDALPRTSGNPREQRTDESGESCRLTITAHKGTY